MIEFTTREDGQLTASGNAWGDGPRNHDPDKICGYPQNHQGPAVNVDGTGIRHGFQFCIAPKGDHGAHPLAYCFTKATPCQILLHAPFKGNCLGVEVGYILESLQRAREHAQRQAEEDLARRRGRLDFYATG